MRTIIFHKVKKCIFQDMVFLDELISLRKLMFIFQLVFIIIPSSVNIV